MFSRLLTCITDYDGDVYRNIKTVRESINCYDDLCDDDLDAQIAVSVEMLGHTQSNVPMITRPFEYGVAVAYPFIDSNWQQSRFSDGQSFGVWYGSEALVTTIYETIYHWKRFLTDSFSTEDNLFVSERRVLLVRCKGILVNVIDKTEEFPDLIDSEGYAFCQGVGSYLHKQNQNGLLTRSARSAGVNLAIFQEEVLSNVRDNCFLSYLWNPAEGGKVNVEREQGKKWIDIE